MQSIRKQAFLLTVANGFTRMLGFGLRLVMARLMGAEALGVMEMAHSVEILALTPVTAGMPTAMSRMIAKSAPDDRPLILRAGLSLTSRIAFILMPGMLLLSPLLAYLLGDIRTLPVLLVNIPCILLLGLGSVYNGYCYGQQHMKLPALNECLEQTVRCVLTFLLLVLFRGSVSIGAKAAIPCTAELIAASVVLIVFLLRIPPQKVASDLMPSYRIELRRLSSPVVAGRLCTTGLRTMNAILIPACLRLSGLTAAAATSQYGLLTGMAMPVLMLPGIATGALSMASAPAVTASERNPERLSALILRLRRLSFLIGLASTAAIIAFSDFISNVLYHTPALAGLLRMMSPLSMLMAMQQVQHGVIHGLALQRRQLTGSLIGSAITTVLIAFLAVRPQFRLYGIAVAMIIGQVFTYFWGHMMISSVQEKFSAIPCKPVQTDV